MCARLNGYAAIGRSLFQVSGTTTASRRRRGSFGNASCAVALCNLLESFGNKERLSTGLLLLEQV